jgi:hypothetical protein
MCWTQQLAVAACHDTLICEWASTVRSVVQPETYTLYNMHATQVHKQSTVQVTLVSSKLLAQYANNALR